MVTRKRAREETEDRAASVADSQPQEHGGLLHQLRNMWEFANLVQYIYMFGKTMKINDDFDIEVSLILFSIIFFLKCSFCNCSTRERSALIPMTTRIWRRSV